MATLSLDLRERIVASYDNEEGTRDQIARRYRVSLGMVKKLLQQRRRTGGIGHFITTADANLSSWPRTGKPCGQPWAASQI